jgi:protein SCO1/2
MSLVALFAAGCRHAPAPTSAVRKYAMRGMVISVNATAGSVELSTDMIPGFMEAMTMSYQLADPTVISELHTGDHLTATLLCDGGPDVCSAMRVTDIVVTAQARPDYMPAMQYHVPAVGDEVPNFTLLNQSGKKIGLAQFRGRVLVLTFVYTRCPLADYCPRMSRNFAQIDKDLAADHRLYAQTHLLTISFDPAYDTPAVLRSYGEAYTGRYTAETFAHWDFAAPDVSEMKPMEEFFDLGVTPGGNGSLQHSLSTLIIGKDGRVVAFYPTKDWNIHDVETVIRKAAE